MRTSPNVAGSKLAAKILTTRDKALQSQGNKIKCKIKSFVIVSK